MKENQQLEAVSTLVGTVIGAGVLGMPYVIAKAGLLNGIIIIILLGIALTILYLYYGEIILRTKKLHQISGYAEKYLGKWGKLIAAISFIISMYGALVAYLFGSGAALSAIFGGSSLLFSLGFFLVGAILIYIGIKAVERSEPVLMVIVIILVMAICFLNIRHIRPEHLTGFSLQTLLIPYGLVLFALLGTNAIPEMREELAGNEKKLKKCIIIGMIIPIIVYIIFSVVVVGVVGLDGFEALDENSRIATIALIPYVGAHMAIIGNIFALFAIATSFLSVGLSLKETFILDLHLDPKLAMLLTFLPPMIPFLFRLTSFIMVLEIMGIAVGGITAFLIIFMFWNAKRYHERKPEYSLSPSPILGWLILGLVLLGTIYGLFAF
jgi:amino acid permease